MQEILWLLQNNLDFETAKLQNQYIRAPWVDPGIISPKILEKLPSPRTFKSHMHIKFLPDDFNKTIKVNLILIINLITRIIITLNVKYMQI